MYEQERLEMVRSQVIGHGIVRVPLLTIMQIVPRELFVPESLQKQAYLEEPLSVGYGHIMNPPYIDAMLLDLVQPSPNKSLLVVGSGTGYLLAIASFLFGRVIGIEAVSELAKKSREVLARLCISRVHILENEKDSSLNKEQFDCIIVTQAKSKLPEDLCIRLSPLGRLVVPMKRSGTCEMICAIREGSSKNCIITHHCLDVAVAKR